MKTTLGETIRELIVKNEAFFVVRIVETSGSTPRKKGACLVVKKDGTSSGSVGGGLLDMEAEKKALDLFESKQDFIYQTTLTSDEKGGLDMRCGGSVTLSFEYMEAVKAEKFLKEVEAKDTVYIFGGGHIGLAVEPILRHVDFETVVIDDRAEFANEGRFPKAKEVHVIEDYRTAFSEIAVKENSYIVIVTRGHRGDLQVLRQCMEKEVAYVGMIGSRKKVADTFTALEKMGVAEEKIATVHAPIGLKIHAETPEEIAISIVAEIIQARWLHGQTI